MIPYQTSCCGTPISVEHISDVRSAFHLPSVTNHPSSVYTDRNTAVVRWIHISRPLPVMQRPMLIPALHSPPRTSVSAAFPSDNRSPAVIPSAFRCRLRTLLCGRRGIPQHGACTRARVWHPRDLRHAGAPGGRLRLDALPLRAVDMSHRAPRGPASRDLIDLNTHLADADLRCADGDLISRLPPSSSVPAGYDTHTYPLQLISTLICVFFFVFYSVL